MISGIEPHVHWRQFCAVLSEVADRAICEMVVTLGRHRRKFRTPGCLPCSVRRRTPPSRRSLGLSRPQYEGITGLAGVLHMELDAPASPRSRCG